MSSLVCVYMCECVGVVYVRLCEGLLISVCVYACLCACVYLFDCEYIYIYTHKEI